MIRENESRSYMPVSKSDIHITPDRVFDIIKEYWGLDAKGMFDPCPENPTFDGLKIGWEYWNFVNPPYALLMGKKKSLLSQFVAKAIQEMAISHYSIMLLPSKTDQQWFHDLIDRKFDIKWIKKRLKFKNNQWSATQPHFLVLIK